MITLHNAQVLKVEQRTGSFDNEKGERVAYDFDLVTVFASGDVIELKVKRDNGMARPKAGDTIAVQLELPHKARPVVVGYIDPKAA